MFSKKIKVDSDLSSLKPIRRRRHLDDVVANIILILGGILFGLLCAAALSSCSEFRPPTTAEERQIFCENVKIQRDAIEHFPGTDEDRAVMRSQLATWALAARCPGANPVQIEEGKFE